MEGDDLSTCIRMRSGSLSSTGRTVPSWHPRLDCARQPFNRSIRWYQRRWLAKTTAACGGRLPMTVSLDRPTRCLLCGDPRIEIDVDGRFVTTSCLACYAVFRIEFNPLDEPTLRGRIERIDDRDEGRGGLAAATGLRPRPALPGGDRRQATARRSGSSARSLPDGSCGTGERRSSV